MHKSDLMKFCEPSIESIAQPFSHAQHTYASNGHILIRTARILDVHERDDAPSLDNINKYFHPSIIQQKHQPIPDMVKSKKIYCSECGGKGKDYNCPECNGAGFVEFDTDYHHYECPCESCHGTRILQGVCPKCDGVGYYFKQEPFQIGTQYYHKRYLAMIRDLPCSVFAPGNNINEPGHFIFAEGDGLLMPIFV